MARSTHAARILAPMGAQIHSSTLVPPRRTRGRPLLPKGHIPARFLPKARRPGPRRYGPSASLLGQRDGLEVEERAHAEFAAELAADASALHPAEGDAGVGGGHRVDEDHPRLDVG